MADDDRGPGRSPLERLGILASTSVEVAPGLRHLEVYTLHGLLTVLWHEPAASDVAGAPEPSGGALLLLGGAMGGLLGPGAGLYQRLGKELAALGHAVLRVNYRSPDDPTRCVHDVLAAAELAIGAGARRFAFGGHSFGGAVAVRSATALRSSCVAVTTFATQSAGLDGAEALAGIPVLAFHGDRDELLPVACSELLVSLTGGELVVVAGEGHLMANATDLLAERLVPFLDQRLSGDAAPGAPGPTGV